MCGLAAGFLFLELALRLVAAVTPASEAPSLRPVPASGPIISSWSTALKTATPRLRILVVGDSFTVGRGVAIDEVYPARLAASLGDRGHAVDIVSYSFPGWNTQAEAHALVKDIDRLDPDLLVVGHCLNDAEERPTGQATANRPELRPWAPEGSVESFLDAHSRLFARVRRALDTLRLRPILRSYYAELYQEQQGWRLWRQALTSIHQMAADRSIPAVLVVFPIFDSNPDRDYPYRELHAAVRQTGEELGYRTLDLLGAYGGMDGHELALVPFTDPHPSALAHDIAGREIASYLDEGNFLGLR